MIDKAFCVMLSALSKVFVLGKPLLSVRER